jgi:nucleotide-binding universal stress UspA family protein
VVDGAPEKAIVSAAEEAGADLVVIGYQHGPGRSFQEHIIGKLGCAVLLVQSGADAPSMGDALANQA